MNDLSPLKSPAPFFVDAFLSQTCQYYNVEGVGYDALKTRPRSATSSHMTAPSPISFGVAPVPPPQFRLSGKGICQFVIADPKAFVRSECVILPPLIDSSGGSHV